MKLLQAAPRSFAECKSENTRLHANVNSEKSRVSLGAISEMSQIPAAPHRRVKTGTNTDW
jgi:hypothetical protein